MIVLWQLVILHSRMGGYVRQFGLNLLAIGLGPVTVFSWWHVNNLEVGLHSYGFTEGVIGLVRTYYVIAGGIIGSGLLWYAFVGPEVANGTRKGPPTDGLSGADASPATS
ncbi:MAG: hypothetical protein AAFZ65_18630, partial [Planctomycetota bacterium]